MWARRASVPFSTEAWTSKKLSPGEEARRPAGVAAIGVYERVSESGNRSGSKRWTCVSHFSILAGSPQWAFVLETIKAIVRCNEVSLALIIVNTA
jgi:hypothetical protein